MSSQVSAPLPLPVVSATDHGPAAAPWQGPPEWPLEISTAVASRLYQLKSQLLNIVVRDLNRDKNQNGAVPQASPEQQEWLDLHPLLNLDPAYLQTLNTTMPSIAWLLCPFEDWIKLELDELLTETQRREYREVGLSSLLAQIDFRWEAELTRKLQSLCAPSLQPRRYRSAELAGNERSWRKRFAEPLEGLPNWSPELRSAVLQRLIQLKSQLVSLVVKFSQQDQHQNGTGATSNPSEENWVELLPLLNLDPDYLQKLQSANPRVHWLLVSFATWIKAEIETLLPEAERGEYKEARLSSLLSQIDFPWDTELPQRLGESADAYAAEIAQLKAESAAQVQGSAVHPDAALRVPPQGTPVLPEAVSRRLFLLKSQLLDLVVALIRFSRAGQPQPTEDAPADADKDNEEQFQRLLNLDEDYLQSLDSSDPSASMIPRLFGKWTETLINELLTEQQQEEFRQTGLSSLLSQTDYPWRTELMLGLKVGFESRPQTDRHQAADIDVPACAPDQEFSPVLEGLNHWPVELHAAVARRLWLLKNQLFDIVVTLLDFADDNQRSGAGHPSNQADIQSGQQGALQLLLNLDEAYLQSVESADPSASWLLRSFGNWTEKLIAELLTAEQLQQFHEVGLSSLLSRIDFPWDTELVNRMNRSNASGQRADYQGLFCPRPFQYVEIGQRGKTHLCCAVMLPTAVGDAQSGTFMDVWNSAKAQEIRQSILDGTFTHCVEHLCPDLKNRTLPKREEVQNPYLKEIIANQLTVLPRGPERITMNYDLSCNLACPMCRTERISIKGEAKRTAEAVQEWATQEHLKDARELVISTAGDAFGSATYHSFLRNFDASPYPNLRLRLLTNGLHLTPKNWERICHEHVDTVHVSIDAATEETYRINRGGDFNLLLKNLHFIGELRSSGRLKSFIFNYTVQENNFAEMPAFVALASAVHADEVIFIQLANGTFSEEVYKQRAVHQPAHPRHGELLEVLKNPLLQMPMVHLQLLGTLCGPQ